MTDLPSNPQHSHMDALAKAIGHAHGAIEEFHDALREVNDERLVDAFQPVRQIAGEVLKGHEKAPVRTIADDAGTLRSHFARVTVPREDPNLGPVLSLKKLRSARGNVLAEFDDILREARALGWLPSNPELPAVVSAEVPASGLEGLLKGLVRRMDAVERLLKEKIEPEGRDDNERSVQQRGLVNFYLGAMKIELSLARLEVSIKAAVDFAGLSRMIENIAGLTADFVATVRGFANKATETLREAANAIKPKVRQVVSGFRALVWKALRRGGGMPPGTVFRDLPFAPEMVVIPPGSFMMGSPEGEGGDAEKPLHKVTIAKAFAAGRFPVTFEEWDAFAASDPEVRRPSDEDWGRGRRPVINVSWNDAKAYVAWLNKQVAGAPYRLLSEAEWEYCCRAGTTTPYATGDEITRQQAQFGSSQTVEVGSFEANSFGLHDMHGNVWEWVEDIWHDSYVGAPGQGDAWIKGGDNAQRVVRGGSWLVNPWYLRCANRDWDGPEDRNFFLGFRVARTVFTP